MTNDGNVMENSVLRTIGLLTAATILVSGCARHLPPAERVQTTNVAGLRAAFGGGATETAAPATAVAEPTGWATLKGAFKLEGTPPARAPIAVTKDHEVCAPGGKPVLSEELVVDSATSGIKDV